MKLSRFEIRNFKNLANVTFDWEGILLLIGENNTGKSSVLLALEWFLSGSQIKNQKLFRNSQCTLDHCIELTAHFTNLTEAEQGAIAVRGRLYDNKWILKKRFWRETDEEGEKWKELYFSYHQVESFEQWPENQRSWNGWPDVYQPLIEEVKQETGSSRVTGDAIEQLKGRVRRQAQHLVSSRTDWIPNPGGGGNWKSNANSILPEFIFVQAVQEVTDETAAKEATTYGKLISLLISTRLAQRPEFIQLNEQIMRVKALFKPIPEHPEWQKAQEIQDLEDAISGRLADIIDATAHIETTELSIPDVILPATALKIDDGFTTSVEDQGHGLQRTLLITLLQVLNQYTRDAALVGTPARSVIFGIEEPELYLHPQLLRKTKDVLTELAAHPGYQVICPTHTPVMIDMADNHRSIVRFEKDDARNITATQVHTDIFAGPGGEEQRQKLRMITEFDSSVNELFFAKRIVLVEGDTEMAVFQKAAELLNMFPNQLDRRDTTFINCRGKGSLLLFMKVLNHFGMRYTVAYDIDLPADTLNARIISEGGAQATLVTFNPNIEGLLGYAAAGKDKPIKAIERLLELHAQNAIPNAFTQNVRAIYGQ